MKMKRMMAAIVALLVLGACLLGGNTLDTHAAVDYEALSASVLRVVVVNDVTLPMEQQVPVALGSGFAIGASPEGPSEYFVTCYHVVEGHLNSVYVGESNQTMIRCTVVKTLENLDIAILKSEYPVNRPPLPLGKQELVKATDDVYAYGFPTADVSDYQGFEPEDVTITKGVVNKKTAQDGVEYYQTDATINKGSSGGPLVHKDGYVIGVNAFLVREADNTSAMVMIDQILVTLGDLGIAYLAAQPAPSQEPTDGNGGGGGSAFWLFVFIFAGIAFLAVLGYLAWQWLRARRAHGGRLALEGGYGGQPILVGVGGQYDRAVIPLEGLVTIGRDPAACQVVYDRDTPGVSRVHCQIRYDESAGVFVLRDLSSGGTLVGGRPIGNGRSVSLRPGEMFYLADTENGFHADLEGA